MVVADNERVTSIELLSASTSSQVEMVAMTEPRCEDSAKHSAHRVLRYCAGG